MACTVFPHDKGKHDPFCYVCGKPYGVCWDSVNNDFNGRMRELQERGELSVYEAIMAIDICDGKGANWDKALAYLKTCPNLSACSLGHEYSFY
jgi:hypothetical protein